MKTTTAGWLTAVLASLVASGVALALMLWARAAFQVRTLPERIMETFLLVIPPDQFEGAIEKYGPAAKEYALYGVTAVMFLALAGIGIASLRIIRRPIWLLAVGIGLWLVAMLAIMPLTGAGPFATGLFQNPVLVNAVYLGVGLAYAALLLGACSLPAPALVGPSVESRRAFVVGAAASVASFMVTLVLGKTSTQIASSLPLASLPGEPGPAPASASSAAPSGSAFGAGTSASGGSLAGSAALSGTASAPPPSGSAPSGSSSAPATDAGPSGSAAAQVSPAGPSGGTAPAAPAGQQPVSQSPAAQPPRSSAPQAASPAAPASPTPASQAPIAYPSPPPERQLARDKDGALLAVNRPKGQLQAAVTPNDDFYVVTKNAGGDPRLEAADWRLIVDGSVNRPVQVDYATLVRLPQVSVYKSLECISNLTAKCELTSFGCDLVSTAKWTGARLRDVIGLAGGLSGGVVAIAAIGADEFSSSLPSAAANDPNVLLVYGMNDAPLPREHGFPVRVIIPDRYGMKNAKWIVNLKAMTQAYVDWYGQRNWSLDGTVKTMSRIDVPAPAAQVPAGQQQIAGIAYGGNRGVSKVEFSADGGRSWQPANLEQPLGKDTFVRWSGNFQLGAGQTAQLMARATDGSGALQIETFNLPQPNGGTGWNSISVSAA